jgi:hypothetical protein
MELDMGLIAPYVYVCEATTASGEPCRREVAKGLSHCYQHDVNADDQRVSKFDDIKKETFLELLRNGATRTTAAAAVGMTRQGIWSHTQKHPAFEELISRAEMVADADVENALFMKARSGNVSAMIFWLKNRQSASWSNDDNSPQQEGNIDMSALTHEELIEARRLSAKVKLIPTEETA